jgi:outer membrane protein OmpA-like peptidoglycan-associated protein
MKPNIISKQGLRTVRSANNRHLQRFIFGALILAAIQVSAQDQGTLYTKPSWYIGAAAGANFNFYRGTTQELNSDLTVPTAFGHGKGVGIFVAPLIEYHRPDTRLGGMLQIGYDGRNGRFDQKLAPCNCTEDLYTRLHYITVEPSLRFAPFRSNFYLFGGPRLAFKIEKSFVYKQQPIAAEAGTDNTYESFSSINKTLISMQIGAGYDIHLSAEGKKAQAVLSPFVSFQPYFGQNPRSIETWTLTTLRVGAALKFGWGKQIPTPTKPSAAIYPTDPTVQFSVVSPKNIPIERRVRETFPLRNYVFFNRGSTEIPDRYVLLTKSQVKDFKEDQLEVFTPKHLSGRSAREMIVYYNVLNIVGDRMGKNSSATITLVGSSSSEKGAKEGTAMAESVKRYLVDIFGIAPGRINIEGRDKPKIPSEQPGATQELDLLREGDRRVSIESDAPTMLMEFQSGPDAPLKPVEFVAVQEAPFDSYLTFNNAGANDAFQSWSLEIKDDQGKVQNFGPYTREKVSIPGKSILGNTPQGNYRVTMVGHTKSGKVVTKETSVHMVLWTQPVNEEGMRFSIIFEFNKSKAIAMYEKYLIDVVVPKIPAGGSIIIHGHTDIIGDEAYNMELSQARAEEVKGILERGLSKTGRTDVQIDVYGFGEDQSLAPFENTYPEERFYNRTVLIDIIPKK